MKPIRFEKSIQWLAEQAVIDLICLSPACSKIHVFVTKYEKFLSVGSSKYDIDGIDVYSRHNIKKCAVDASEFRAIRDEIITALRKLVSEGKIEAKDEEVDKIFKQLSIGISSVKKVDDCFVKYENDKFEVVEFNNNWEAFDASFYSCHYYPWASQIMNATSFANAPVGTVIRRPE